MRFIRDILKDQADDLDMHANPEVRLRTNGAVSMTLEKDQVVPRENFTLDDVHQGEDEAQEEFEPELSDDFDPIEPEQQIDEDVDEHGADVSEAMADTSDAIDFDRATSVDEDTEHDLDEPVDFDAHVEQDPFDTSPFEETEDLGDPFGKLMALEEPVSASPPRASVFRAPKAPQFEGTSLDEAPKMDNAEDAHSPLNDMMALADAAEPEELEMPSPTVGRGSNRSGRVKTRLLGFSAAAFAPENPFEQTKDTAANTFPVGWLVVVSEKGRGASFALQDGVSTIGRSSDQTVCLDFGDNSISRENHVSVAYDSEQNKFFIGHSGKANLVRLNNAPLLSTETLSSGDLVRLGETVLRFIAFCDDGFDWSTPAEKAGRRD